MKRECCNCAKLVMEEGVVPVGWVTGKYYTCSEGRYSIGASSYKQWFAWSGIVKPNKTVAVAQKDCPCFEAMK